MIMYFAGVQGHIFDLDVAVKNGCMHIMLSYHYRKTLTPLQFKRFRSNGLHIFLDSGAYSAWKSGAQIDIDDYMSFIKDNSIGKYIVLDVVGDPEKTYYNLTYMRDKGFNPVPVFHYGSDFKYLKKLEEDGYKYICLGGTVGLGKKDRDTFFDKCFNEYPHIMFHGLGMTDVDLMTKYKWRSVDSTTWFIGRKYGKLQTRKGRIKLPEDMSIEEKIALNVRFFDSLK